MEYYEVYANRIIKLCEERKITINRLASMSGVRQSTIDNIIHGVSKNPTVRTIHQIATGFSMTMSEFMDFPELDEYPIGIEDEK